MQCCHGGIDQYGVYWVQGTAKSKALPTAFVTFKDTFTTTVAATSMMHHDLRHWSTRAAPSPRVHPLCTLLLPG